MQTRTIYAAWVELAPMVSMEEKLEDRPHVVPILCPSCRAEMDITQTQLGVEFRCRQCGRTVYFSED